MCNGARTVNFKVIEFFLQKEVLIGVNNYYATYINTSQNLTQSLISYQHGT